MKAHKVQRALLAAGWRLARVTANQHYLYQTPAGQLVTVPGLHDSRDVDRFLALYVGKEVRRDKRRIRKQAQ